VTPDTWLTIFKGMLYVGTLLVAIATIGMSIFSAKVDRSKDRKIDDLLAGSRQLQTGNEELLAKIAAYQTDLAAKQQEIETLKTQAAKAERGQYATWDFNGVRREGRAGQITTTLGNEVGVFQKFAELEKQGKHEDIVRIATEQIAKTPDWLTPYFARGIALANIGRRDEAIRDLEYVVGHSHGDANYAGAAKALDKLRQHGGQ
jgi:tetratricopeptide (TPR) repeat protein